MGPFRVYGALLKYLVCVIFQSFAGQLWLLLAAAEIVFLVRNVEETGTEYYAVVSSA